MIHQGALVASDHSRLVKSERILKGEFTEIIHLHLKKDAIMEEHLSKSDAVLVVVEGEIDFVSQGKYHRLGKGDYLTFAADVLHAIEAHEDTHLILIK